MSQQQGEEKMEKEKRENRRFVAIVFAVLTGFAVMVFWALYLGLSGVFMPSIVKIPLIFDLGYKLPFEISRGWDIPAVATIVYIFFAKKERDMNLIMSVFVIVITTVSILLFGGKIFIPLFALEIVFGLTLGLFIFNQKKNTKITKKEDVFNLLSKDDLVVIWVGLSIATGFFYGFVIGVVLAIVSTINIAFFALVVFFWKKDWKKLLKFSLAICALSSLTGLFISGNILANLTATLIFGGLFIFCMLVLWALNPHYFKKEE